MKGRYSSTTHTELVNHLTRDRLEHNKLIMGIKEAKEAGIKKELEEKLARIKAEIADLTAQISTLNRASGYNHDSSSPSFAMKRKESFIKK